MAAAVAGAALMPVAANASVTFEAAAANLAASVTFDAVPGVGLVVTLTNTSTFKSLVNADGLTGVFFSGLPGLNNPGPVGNTSSALIGSGGTILNVQNNYTNYDTLAEVPQVGGLYNVGGEWAFDTKSGLPNGATKGFSSSGLGVFSGPNLNGPDLQNPTALDGIQYGIVSASTNASDVTNGFGNFAMIKNSVVFTLSTYTGGEAGLSSIANVSFQYGTNLNEPNLIPTVTVVCPGGTPYPCSNLVVETPEPTGLAILGVGMIGLAAVRRRKAA